MDNEVPDFDETIDAVWRRSQSMFGIIFDDDLTVAMRNDRIKNKAQQAETADHIQNRGVVIDIAESMLHSTGQDQTIYEQAIASLDRRYGGAVQTAIKRLREETQGHVLALI